ncbi:TetR/AcrR family transcriptional regulator [Pseudonocardia ailaonensis]|uniref:TetR/AcrR family transcriptional regulator n=1 Tax=Pseudonocardia ailaonensis TaxID=367279 RepID=A0ABN2N5Y9_9PSEU
MYAREGWSRFTFESIAKEAQVGKPGLYRRWDTPLDLLFDALAQLELPIPRDRGSLRADLVDYGMQYIRWFEKDEVAGIGARLEMDRRHNPALRQHYDERARHPRLAAEQGVIDRAVGRGETTRPDDVRLVIDMMLGALGVRWDFRHARHIAQEVNEFPSYVERVVALAMAGLTNAELPAGRPAAATNPPDQTTRPAATVKPRRASG